MTEPGKLDRIIAEARRAQDERAQGYRERALKIYPWICGRCAREFTHRNVRELTVHHRDHNHDNNPPDGSNWELGWVMTGTFIASGLMMAIFALGLHLSLPRSPLTRIASLTLTCAGLALAGPAFTTDPTIRSTPATWHGRLHDLSFVLLGLTLMPAMILLGLAFRQDARWRDLSLYSWMTVALALPTFWLKGAAFYIFMLAVLVWSGAVARRLSSLAD